MNLLHRSYQALLLVAVLLFSGAAEAQVIRPNGTFFVGGRVGATAYGGELDSCADTAAADADDDCELGWLFEDLGLGFGLELGYQFTQGFGFSVLGLYGEYENLDREDASLFEQTNESDAVPQIHALFRLTPAPSWRFTPFVEFGGGIAFAGDRVVERDDDNSVAYGPTFGGGFDLLIGRQLSLFLLAEGTLWFPDDGFDGLGDAVGDDTDEADFDASTFYGGGLRFFFRPPYVEVEAAVQCASELTVGESGSFTASYNDDASEPLSFRWDFGDGATASGLTASHAYSAPGTYTVTFMAEGPANTDTRTCTVTVISAPPALASCRVSPTRVGNGETVTVSANVTGTEPVDVMVDFGDGEMASALPARHAYDEPGTYTVTITASNEGGEDTCTATVEVGDTFCAEIRELNSVYLDFEMSSLSAEARSRLDENIELLRRCPEVCVVINGYADPQERDQLRLSDRRAQEAMAYYVANGIDESRITARGLGEAPSCNPKEDPGPGDRNCRRVESIPTDCDRMGN